jgi:hypothetical protein
MPPELLPRWLLLAAPPALLRALEVSMPALPKLPLRECAGASSASLPTQLLRRTGMPAPLPGRWWSPGPPVHHVGAMQQASHCQCGDTRAHVAGTTQQQ